MLVSINSENPQMRLIRKAVDILENGGIVIYPTDTVYGIGCDLLNRRAIERIYDIKQRSRKQPFSFICADLKDISQYAIVPNYAYKAMKRLLPGPYTFVLEASRLVPRIILPKRKSVGIRVPDNRICLALVSAFGRPVISTSVTTADGDIMTDPGEIEEKFKNRVDMVIDGGILPPAESSVVSFLEEVPEVIRVGKGDVNIFQ
ncbi:MAG TPA: L-threonylcarbamoyladenylate synthase [Syntrophales bacterium]|nr:L-threonylcarbamoyladenylate synthase [Syntrophales bacterium]